MTFKKTFCPSPWFHMRITNAGQYEYCRWATAQTPTVEDSIKRKSPIYWFQHGMSDIRRDMLNGTPVAGCQDCYKMEQHGKISGRQKQLLKIGVTENNFEKSLLSSSWIETLAYSKDHDGDTNAMVQDWQIDLGNFCNSACVFCVPEDSSRLAAEFKRIGFIKEMPDADWCSNLQDLDLFLQTLEQTPHLAYLHFIGGETLITPAFKTILESLVGQGLNKKVSIGFTTNLTTWDQSIADLLAQFKEVNLGMSVECFHPVNDYIRYGSDIGTVEQLMLRWIDFAKASNNCLIQLRTTPTVLSIGHLYTVYDIAWKYGLNVESCNFLNRPSFMRSSVLPMNYRTKIIKQLENWLVAHPVDDHEVLLNTRHPDMVRQQIVQDVKSYIDYLSHQADESNQLPDLVKYLKALEQSRRNNILEYLPTYEELLRSAGY